MEARPCVCRSIPPVTTNSGTYLARAIPKAYVIESVQPPSNGKQQGGAPMTGSIRPGHPRMMLLLCFDRVNPYVPAVRYVEKRSVLFFWMCGVRTFCALPIISTHTQKIGSVQDEPLVEERKQPPPWRIHFSLRRNP
jgi:hypothetical protein